MGPSVKIPCVVDAAGTAGEFKFPAEWGGSSMQCRDPVPCLADFPVPPYHSGLMVSNTDFAQYEFHAYSNFTINII